MAYTVCTHGLCSIDMIEDFLIEFFLLEICISIYHKVLHLI